MSTVIKTRFPPEPNGYLHLGHAKSMFINFNYPFDINHDEITKTCNLRYDDTNPKTESKEYADNILADLSWLGYKPDKITYTSDYFADILKLTWTLVNNGDAYCDPSTGEEIKKQRHNNVESPYRDRDISENKTIFQDMIDGKYKEGEMSLRLKIPIEDRTNECMIDPIAYRIIEHPHFRTGTTYNVYPSYEYSHYIVDSIQEITHSFCTLEFYVRRNLSYWILDKLGLKRMIISETNRLETDFGLLSKRKIKALIESGEMNGWDDPRLLTISGLKKRGLSPEIIRRFCQELGYTKHNNSIIQEHVLDYCIRSELNTTAPRRMAVFNPLKLKLRNFNEIRITSKPVYPHILGNTDKVMTYMSPTVYIERDDFRVEANRKYKRLTPTNLVRLKYAGLIKYVSHSVDEAGEIDEVVVDFIPESKDAGKVSGTIHWVSYKKGPNVIKMHRWNYPNKTNPNGNHTSQDIYIDDLMNEDYAEHWQLERVAYIHLEPGSCHATHLTSLKEDPVARKLRESQEKETKKK